MKHFQMIDLASRALGKHNRVVGTATALFVSLVCVSARADVRYDFTSFSAFPVNGESVTGSFSAIVPDFLSVSTDLSPASLLSCTATTNSGESATCLEQWFRPGPFNLDSIGFGVATERFEDRHINYYFDLGAFSAYGNYSTVAFGQDQFATLAVSQVVAVPEPATWSFFIAGLGVLGATLRKKAGTTKQTPSPVADPA